MHLNAFLMLSEKAATMPLGRGGIAILYSRFATLCRFGLTAALRHCEAVGRGNLLTLNNNQSIHLIINQINSL